VTVTVELYGFRRQSKEKGNFDSALLLLLTFLSRHHRVRLLFQHPLSLANNTWAIADWYCHEAKEVFEIDGLHHQQYRRQRPHLGRNFTQIIASPLDSLYTPPRSARPKPYRRGKHMPEMNKNETTDPVPTTSGKTQTISPEGITSAAAFGTPTIWQTYRFAPEWFNDAINEARTGKDHHSRRREIIFSVCCAESYILEWVIVDVIKRDMQRLNKYFPPGRRRGVTEKWKEIPRELKDDGLIPATPQLSDSANWGEFRKLIGFRDGLIHASASRPENPSLHADESPVPSKTQLDNLSAGWAIGAVVAMIRNLNRAAGTPDPNWLQDP
jgi:hypothetical protein